MNNINCCVYGCHSRKSKNSDLHFHSFPPKNSVKVNITNKYGITEKVDKRKAWEYVLLMGKPVGKYMKVCSLHFKPADYIPVKGIMIGIHTYLVGKKCIVNLLETELDFIEGVPRKKAPYLKQTAIPSQNLPRSSFHCEKVENKRRYDRLERRQAMRENLGKENRINTNNLCSDSNSELIYQEKAVPVKARSEISQAEQTAVDALISLCNISFTKENDIEQVILKSDRSCQVTSGDFLHNFISKINDESALLSLTGIHSFALLQKLVDLCTKFYPKKTLKLCVKDKIILVFMKLKLGISFRVISFLFNVTPSSCSAIFNEYVQILANILQNCIVFPSLEEVRQNLPKCFEDFGNVRVIVDCTEIPVQKPKCLCCKIRTYSFYKGRNTLKMMTGVTPGGLLSFVSRCYGGRSSDKAIFEQSRLIDKLEPYIDSVMVDKGFAIDNICSERGIKLIRPPFLRKKAQLSKEESILNARIAKARVHVERMNQRIRQFNILNNQLPWHFVRCFDNIVIICCAMANLQTPILSDVRF